ncbi:MAG: hypothetical protein LRY67_04640 [Gammaproteobacteria bacterium]|nr:hypothetical protein [Gammaproteobacteria bacterium]MCD8542612.1 hypothetical protein [Gammaproteobacteria bacterium]
MHIRILHAIVWSALSLSTLQLSGCANAISPQNTAPTHEAQCAAMRTQILQSPLNENNHPSAIASRDAMETYQQYHDECET